MKQTKSVYRIVPTVTEKLGACWALKQDNTVVGIFVSKQLAEAQKKKLETINLDNFKISNSSRLEIKF